ncbi:acetylornithine deacetylase [Pelagivirga sediminicola]|uniref:Acetylornithine deacetylase n=1 Tax=Pelagivirga sediminicola TaxID=2170575 RepID=A0A2T7G8I0_9RHOB|nr:acetylornithine deacetylase [Pelagivirga sediminicola]PVA10721.1 acetylornithine deacetylase [Pelagivirga sediminicola]
MTPHRTTLDILARLVAFPTVSAESNLALIDYAEDLLHGAGFTTQRMPDPENDAKCGLAARIGPQGPGGVLLSAHSDVVPVEGQAWTRPPFELTREDGKLFGRGTTDMKGFLASMLSLAQRVGDSALAAPLMLVISYDEEVGCLGIRKMMPDIARLGWAPELCIVGEPTMMKPATGHKGKAALRATCRGIAGHSALAPRYVNALHLGADFITALREIQREYEVSGVRDAAYDVPYSTTHAGRMQGGTALNIVPEAAQIDFELRHLPADSLQAFQDRVARVASQITAPFADKGGQVGIDIEVTNTYPGLEIAPDSAAVQRVAGLCGSNDLTKVAFGTEAGFFAAMDIPAVVCGPGSMEGQGHQADEFVTLAQLGQCDAMMDRLKAQIADI